MQIMSVFDTTFAPYGRVIADLDCTELLDTLRKTTDKPEDAVVYVPSAAQLEALPVFDTLRDSVYGGMPIQIGYCNGSNTKLNCVEYHRDSEINIVADDMVFLVGLESDITHGKLDTASIRAFVHRLVRRLSCTPLRCTMPPVTAPRAQASALRSFCRAAPTPKSLTASVH